MPPRDAARFPENRELMPAPPAEHEHSDERPARTPAPDAISAALDYLREALDPRNPDAFPDGKAKEAAARAELAEMRGALKLADKLAAEVDDKMTGRVQGLIVDACAAYRAARGAK